MPWRLLRATQDDTIQCSIIKVRTNQEGFPLPQAYAGCGAACAMAANQRPCELITHWKLLFLRPHKSAIKPDGVLVEF